MPRELIRPAPSPYPHGVAIRRVLGERNGTYHAVYRDDVRLATWPTEWRAKHCAEAIVRALEVGQQQGARCQSN